MAVLAFISAFHDMHKASISHTAFAIIYAHVRRSLDDDMRTGIYTSFAEDDASHNLRTDDTDNIWSAYRLIPMPEGAMSANAAI